MLSFNLAYPQGTNYALMFGTNIYDTWEDLFNPINDVESVGLKLSESYGFKVEIIRNHPETIIDNSTFEKPNLYASGVVHVFVNGVPVLQNEEMTGNAPGKYLNRNKEANMK